MLDLASKLAETNPLVSQYYIGITGLAKQLASRYDQVQNEDDFVQVALITACKYEERYVEDTATFYTYCKKPIITAIQAEFGNPNSGTKTYKALADTIAKYQEEHGSYPDVSTLKELTGFSISEIIGVYYDKYRDVSLQSLSDDADVKDIFKSEDTMNIEDHFGVLSQPELILIDALYYREQSIKELSTSLGIPVKKLMAVHKSALEKLKVSMEEL